MTTQPKRFLITLPAGTNAPWTPDDVRHAFDVAYTHVLDGLDAVEVLPADALIAVLEAAIALLTTPHADILRNVDAWQSLRYAVAKARGSDVFMTTNDKNDYWGE